MAKKKKTAPSPKRKTAKARSKARGLPKPARSSRQKPSQSRPKTARFSSKQKPKLTLKRAKFETFDLSFPEPAQRPAPPTIPQHEPLDVPPMPASESIEEKKRVPHAANALLASAILSGLFGIVFILLLGIDPLFSLGICVAIFLGFAILFFNIFETGGFRGPMAK